MTPDPTANDVITTLKQSFGPPVHSMPREGRNPHHVRLARRVENDSPRQASDVTCIRPDVTCIRPAPELLEDSSAWEGMTLFIENIPTVESHIEAMDAPVLYTVAKRVAERVTIDDERDFVKIMRDYGLLPSPLRSENDRVKTCARQLRFHAYHSELHVAKRSACDELVRIMERLS